MSAWAGCSSACVLIAFAAAATGCAARMSSDPAAALRLAFPSVLHVRSGPAADAARILVAEGPAGPEGYAVSLEVVSRSGPFEILVIIDPALRVRRADVLRYPGERGWEVRSRVFTRQFEGKGPRDPIRIGEDIDAMTGATISSNAMAGGVRRAIRLVREAAAS